MIRYDLNIRVPLAAAAVVVLWLASETDWAVISYDLGESSVAARIASLDVGVAFDPESSDNLGVVLLQIDVAGSNDLLTASGSDYSAFSFTPSGPLLDGWSLLSHFGAGLLKSVVAYDLVGSDSRPQSSLTAGRHWIGHAAR